MSFRSGGQLTRTVGSYLRPLWGLLGIAAFLVIWQVASTSLAKPVQFPTPGDVVDDALAALGSGELWTHITASLSRIAVGYSLAVVVAIPLGTLMGLSRHTNAAFDPIIEILRPISAVAWVPILLVTIGVGGGLYYAVTFYGSFFPILINTASGVRSADRTHLQAAQTLGATPLMTVREAVLPGAYPAILTGMRVGMGTGWVSIVAAELIGASTGLGYMISWNQKIFNSGAVVTGMITIGIIGLVINYGMLLLQRRLTHWSTTIA